MRGLARLAAFIYYRTSYRGGTVPSRGPVLLVANHPNSLLDPMLVAAAAGRKVRFLAKAPLFDDPKVGWLMRASRSIPVYRRQDNPSQLGRNAEMFSAVHTALVGGSAVAIFPEGISHSEPSLVEIKTGAARIALGAAARYGGAFPIVPIGIDLRDKVRFRSEAQVDIGAPVEWDDLAGRGVDDADAVRLLTDRIEAALRTLTVNLDAWHDAPLVDSALRIWEAADPARTDPDAHAMRRDITTRMLARVRAEQDAEGIDLAADIQRHHGRLARLGITPAQLGSDPGSGTVATNVVLRLTLLLPLMAIIGVIAWACYLVPYHITGRLVDRFRPELDIRATWKLMLGAVIYVVWTVVVALVTGVAADWWIALLVLLLLPVIGMVGLLVREEWRSTRHDARRWLLQRSRPGLIAALRSEQDDLAVRLDRLRCSLAPVGATVKG